MKEIEGNRHFLQGEFSMHKVQLRLAGTLYFFPRYLEGQPVLMPNVADLTAERTKELRALAKQIFEDGK
jgi:hypothetical protein